MKLSEVGTERVFNLEISETDLQLLFGVMCYKRSSEEGLTETAQSALSRLASFMTKENMASPERADIVERLFY